MVCIGVVDGWSTTRGSTLVPSLALRGVAPDGHLITSDSIAWWRMVLSLVCALTCHILLVAMPPLRAWFYHRVLASHLVRLDAVEVGHGC